MTFLEIRQHVRRDHDGDVVVKVAGGDETYMRGFHDGAHGRLDADGLRDQPGHEKAGERSEGEGEA